MSDRATLAKARRELEELYLGVPDDSVNLTFQDFAQVSQNLAPPPGKKKQVPSQGPVKKMDSISESTPKHDHFQPPFLTKAPSLDFSRGLEASSITPDHHHNRRHQDRHVMGVSPVVGLPPYGHHHQVEEVVKHGYNHGDHDYYGHHGVRSHGHDAMKSPVHGHHGMKSPHVHGHVMENSMAYDDLSVMSGMSITSMYQEKSGRRRPGIPHSNICTVCSVYIYIFRNRCLVCGRVYCRQCLNVGMGEMSEGRKCVDCMGRKFSQRYIHRAGNVGCWSTCFNGYPSGVKTQELKWAEKGPRRSGENMYNRSVMMSQSRSPLGAPRTPNRSHIVARGPPSFVTTPEYSPYATPTRHHLPF
ncbi:hypothetical protein E3N88_11196 [Mikania micrantha]|uniref:FYVE-type domain-containing protein n=1 Tax=Mikania micrantha TaxID=192012 RepID=A0A5N6PCU8_9ASTR|nr:hypothetical protein E3N88_11196 [Mikania micrantha]